MCVERWGWDSLIQVFFFVFFINTFNLINSFNSFSIHSSSSFLYYHCSHSTLFVPNPVPPLCLWTSLSFSCFVQLPFVYGTHYLYHIFGALVVCSSWGCPLSGLLSLLKFFPFYGDWLNFYANFTVHIASHDSHFQLLDMLQSLDVSCIYLLCRIFPRHLLMVSPFSSFNPLFLFDSVFFSGFLLLLMKFSLSFLPFSFRFIFVLFTLLSSPVPLNVFCSQSWFPGIFCHYLWYAHIAWSSRKVPLTWQKLCFPITAYLLEQNHVQLRIYHPYEDLGISWNMYYTGVNVEVKYSKYSAERSR